MCIDVMGRCGVLRPALVSWLARPLLLPVSNSACRIACQRSMPILIGENLMTRTKGFCQEQISTGMPWRCFATYSRCRLSIASRLQAGEHAFTVGWFVVNHVLHVTHFAVLCRPRQMPSEIKNCLHVYYFDCINA